MCLPGLETCLENIHSACNPGDYLPDQVSMKHICEFLIDMIGFTFEQNDVALWNCRTQGFVDHTAVVIG